MAKRNFGTSINLTALKHVKMTKKGKSGMIEGIFIPIDANDVVRGKKPDADGNIALYVNATVFLNEEVDSHGQIGSIKQSQSKKWADLSDAEKEVAKSLPYLGNLKEFGGDNTPVSNAASTATFDGDGDDDLPF